MPLAPTREGTWLHSEARDLEFRLQTLDPRLSLIIRTIKHRGRTGKRYEVWRHTEEGQDVIIGHWRIEEFYQIEADVTLMRAALQRPDEVPSAEQRIDKVNDKLDRDNSSQVKDVLGEMHEHAFKLWHDLNNPRNVFRQVGGVGRDAS